MPSPDDERAADARLEPFSSRAGFLFGGLTAAMTLVYVAMLILVSFVLTSQPGVTATGIDFRVFWAAGQLAMDGTPLTVLDTAKLSAVHDTYVDANMLWLYPPGFLVIVTPLGTVSYSVAFTLWTLVSLGLVAWAVWPFVAGIVPVWLAVSLAPALYPVLLLGQNSLLLMAGLLAALAALRRERWVLAGVFIGLLTLKPQLGIMIPFALLAIRAWRTILAASITTIAVVVLPTLAYGVEYWTLLQANLAEHSANLLGAIGVLDQMISPMDTLTFIGVPPAMALQAQWAILAASAIAVYLLWRSDRVGFDVKVAGLLIAILLSAPYLWYYEGALMSAIALFMLRGGILGTRPLHLCLLALLWLGAGLQALNVFVEAVDHRWLGAAIIPPLLIVCFALCLRPILVKQLPDLKSA
jgi:arabinofuranan 3-O-arabinosyltransferase